MEVVIYLNKHILLRFLRFFLVVGSIIILYLAIKYIIIYFFPFLIALLFSFFLHPIVTFLEKKLKFPRIFGALAIVCFVFIAISGIAFFLITEVIHGTTYLAIKIPDHYQTFINQFELFLTNKFVPMYNQLSLFIKSLHTTQQTTIQENIQQFTSQLATSGTLFLKNTLLKIPSMLSMIPYSITIVIFTVIATILITNDWLLIKRMSHKLVPMQLKDMSKNIVTYFEKSLFGYIKAQCILISISASITLIGLLMLDINHALTITMIIAIVDLLPLIGTGIIFIPWIGYLFFTGHYPLTIGLAIIYIVIIIVRQILEPKVLSANIGVSPLIALVVLFMSIQWWGMIGVLITPIILVTINTCYRAGVFKSIWYYVIG